MTATVVNRGSHQVRIEDYSFFKPGAEPYHVWFNDALAPIPPSDAAVLEVPLDEVADYVPGKPIIAPGPADDRGQIQLQALCAGTPQTVTPPFGHKSDWLGIEQWTRAVRAPFDQDHKQTSRSDRSLVQFAGGGRPSRAHMRAHHAPLRHTIRLKTSLRRREATHRPASPRGCPLRGLRVASPPSLQPR